MEGEKKEPKRGTLESFFASASAKKQKAHCQSTQNGTECMLQLACDDVLTSSTPETPILLTIPDDGCTQQSKLTEPASPSSIQELGSTVLPSPSSQVSLIPGDISRTGNEHPAQPKVSFYKKNIQNRSFQAH